MRVVREEIFGPVLVAQRYDDLDEVAKAANDTAYGLAASRLDPGCLARCTSSPRSCAPAWSGAIATDDPTRALPFGGYKQSGFGRESGRYGIETYTELKTVAIAL